MQHGDSPKPSGACSRADFRQLRQRVNPRPMPSIHTSLLTAMPAGVGQTLPGLCRAGVRASMARSEPENPVSAAPASAFGTKGASR